jgi:putative transposase
MDEAKTEVLAFTGFPRPDWSKGWSTNPLERVKKEIKRPARVVTIFPNDSIIRLVGAVLAEQHDDWAEGRRYLGIDVLARSRITLFADTSLDTDTSPTQQEEVAISA